MRKIRILNIEIANWRMQEFLEQLSEGVVVTPNIDHFVKLQKDREFYECYRQAEHVVCDSRIIQLVSRLLYPGKGIVEQIAGSDLFPAFCHFHRKNTDAIKVFLLGGTPESVRIAQNSINQRCGSAVVIDGYSPPFGFDQDTEMSAEIIERINASGATVLAVGVGAPKQEKWITRHRHQLAGVKLFFAIGATIDFQAGRVQRAPRWMVTWGLEWLFRLCQEPGRLFRRYLVDDLPFFWLIFKQRIGLYKNPWQ
jgi:N-acetylglucosaminyldiphosphoundecaprenol N-acetyl-beta-D-mannosaminyltransferase